MRLFRVKNTKKGGGTDEVRTEESTKKKNEIKGQEIPFVLQDRTGNVNKKCLIES